MTAEQQNRELSGYRKMLSRVLKALEDVEHKTAQTLESALEAAKERAVELGELTREEAERIGDYVRRDLRDLAAYLEREEKDLAGWLRVDLGLIEAEILDFFSRAVDTSRIELAQWQEGPAPVIYRTGEITPPGTLRCLSCGEELHFGRTAHIPPCPKCRGTEFARVHGPAGEETARS
jgi:hypothetical protein